jgi:PAS domain S-box-containing protein
MRRILIVDDNQANRYLLRALLQGHGYDVEEAEDGQEAWARAQARIPDMIVSDILMPKIDGFTLCRMAKADDRLKNVPFIFYTATYTDPRDEKLAYTLGVDAFIVKPADPDDFLKRMEEVLLGEKSGEKRLERTAEPQADIVLKEYNEALIRKLEQKMASLEEVNKALEGEMARREKLETSLRESECRYRSLFENSLDAVLLTSPDGSVHAANPAACRMFGRSEEEICQGGRRVLMDSQDPKLALALEERQRTGRFCGELTGMRADGTKFPCELSSVIFQSADGRPMTSIIIRDISKRRELEAALVRKAEEWQKTFDAVHDAVWLMDADNKILRVNQATRRFFDVPFEEMIGKPCWEIVHRTPHPMPGCPVLRVTKSRARETMEVEWGGRWFQISLDPIFDASGGYAGAVHILSDITERKKQEAQHLRLLKILEASLNELYVFDVQTLRFEYVNQAACRNLGFSDEQFTRMTPLDIKPEFSEDGFRQVLAPLIRHEEDQVAVFTIHRRADGSTYPVEAHLQLIEIDHQKLCLAVIMDITERKRAEAEKEAMLAELHEREIQYRMLADSGIALIWMSGPDKKCVYFNEPWLKFTGRTLEEESGDGWVEGVHPDDLDRCLETYNEAFDQRRPFDMEYRLRNAAGEYRWIRDMGVPNYSATGEFKGYIGHCFDVTDARQAQEAIRRLNETLEREVAKRTVELRQKIDELEELNRVFVGRELRMAELKAKIAELEKKDHDDRPGKQQKEIDKGRKKEDVE